MLIRAVIFDLDGVIVSTDQCHFKAWQRLAQEEGIYFDRDINQRQRGIDRMASLEVLLERAQRPYSPKEKQELAERKNSYYRALLKDLSPRDILPGVMPMLEELKRRGVKIAVGSASKNTPLILAQIELSGFFDAVSDGNRITRSKPDPEVFLAAAADLGVVPQQCAVVEDAIAGVTAALAAGMRAVAIGYAACDERAHLRAPDLSHITVDQLLGAEASLPTRDKSHR